MMVKKKIIHICPIFLTTQEKEKITLQQHQKQQEQQQLQQQQQQQLLLSAAAAAVASSSTSSKKKTRPGKQRPDLKLRCGACGAKGHMRTNKACPKFVASELEMMGPVNVAMTEKDEEELEKEVLELEGNEELVNVEGTKISLSSKLLKHTDDVRRRTMQLKVPKKVLRAAAVAAAGGGTPSSAAAAAAAAKKRRAGATEHCDYLTKSTYRMTKRRRTDPLVSLASILEDLLSR